MTWTLAFICGCATSPADMPVQITVPALRIGGASLEGSGFVPWTDCPSAPLFQSHDALFRVWLSVRARGLPSDIVHVRVDLADGTGAKVSWGSSGTFRFKPAPPPDAPGTWLG